MRSTSLGNYGRCRLAAKNLKDGMVLHGAVMTSRSDAAAWLNVSHGIPFDVATKREHDTVS
jgi:hypothetical protein